MLWHIKKKILFLYCSFIMMSGSKDLLNILNPLIYIFCNFPTTSSNFIK